MPLYDFRLENAWIIQKAESEFCKKIGFAPENDVLMASQTQWHIHHL